MEHHFNIEYAKDYGIVEAVLIDHFQFWLAKNAANNINFFEGRYWTYNSVQAYAKLFPYLTADKVRRAIEKLVSAGVLIKGNFNKKAMDRTAWYSLRDDMLPSWQSRRDDLADSPNASGKNAEPIPDNSTTGTIPFTDVDSSPRNINITSENISTSKKVKKEFDLSFVNIAFEDIFNEWLDYKKARGESYKDQHSLEVCYRRLLDLSNNDPRTAQLIIEEAIASNYKGFFALKQQSKQQSYGSSSTSTTSRAQQLAAELKRNGYQF